jgi:predicted  nucleic acid-binding Zn-ribbon protein
MKTTLNNAPTTAEEKAHFARFVQSLPECSYLRPMMQDIQFEVENAITNDISFLDFRERIEAQREHVKEISELQTRRNELQQEIKDLQARAAAAERELWQIRTAWSDLRGSCANLEGILND